MADVDAPICSSCEGDSIRHQSMVDGKCHSASGVSNDVNA